MDSSWAGRMKLQVLTTTTSASAAVAAGAYPARARRSAIPSPSTAFLGQPRFSTKYVRWARVARLAGRIRPQCYQGARQGYLAGVAAAAAPEVVPVEVVPVEVVPVVVPGVWAGAGVAAPGRLNSRSTATPACPSTPTRSPLTVRSTPAALPTRRRTLCWPVQRRVCPGA